MDDRNIMIANERFIKAVNKALKPIIKAVNHLAYELSVIFSGEEQYKITEKLHPRKKKRGSIRRKRKRDKT